LGQPNAVVGVPAAAQVFLEQRVNRVDHAPAPAAGQADAPRRRVVRDLVFLIPEFRVGGDRDDGRRSLGGDRQRRAGHLLDPLLQIGGGLLFFGGGIRGDGDRDNGLAVLHDG